MYISKNPQQLDCTLNRLASSYMPIYLSAPTNTQQLQSFTNLVLLIKIQVYDNLPKYRLQQRPSTQNIYNIQPFPCNPISIRPFVWAAWPSINQITVIATDIQQFQVAIGTNQMQKEQYDSDQKYLPSHLLDDDDVPTATSLKNPKSLDKQLAFSAPPILLNLEDRIEQDFFDDLKTWSTPSYSTPQKLTKREKSSVESEFDMQVSSTRKLSLQNEQQYLKYEGYQNTTIPTTHYFSVYSPQQQILNNLHYVSDWCKDQYGSRNVQTVLETGDDSIKNKIFDSLSSDLPKLVYDKFGNYVVQKYIQIGTEKHKQIIYNLVKKQLLFISLHSYGCRVIQKIVEYAQNKNQIQKEIMKHLEPHLLQIIVNQNGNHIIQKTLELFNLQATEVLSDIVFENLQKLAFHPFGCRVVQKYLENGRDEQKRLRIMELLIRMTMQLSKCQYGNYIMQYIVCHSKQLQPQVFKVVVAHFSELSCNKFASNVIEKIIKSASTKLNDSLIESLLLSQQFITIAKNQFGNYVIQSLLQRSSKQRKNQLKSKLKQNYQQISKSPYGKHVLLQLQKLKPN